MSRYDMAAAEVLVESVVCQNDMLRGRGIEVHKSPFFENDDDDAVWMIESCDKSVGATP